jgi:hypothetical protein
MECFVGVESTAHTFGVGVLRKASLFGDASLVGRFAGWTLRWLDASLVGAWQCKLGWNCYG